MHRTVLYCSLPFKSLTIFLTIHTCTCVCAQAKRNWMTSVRGAFGTIRSTNTHPTPEELMNVFSLSNMSARYAILCSMFYMYHWDRTKCPIHKMKALLKSPFHFISSFETFTFLDNLFCSGNISACLYMRES